MAIPPAAVITLDPRTRVLLMAVRRALLMVTGAIEEYLGIPKQTLPTA